MLIDTRTIWWLSFGVVLYSSRKGRQGRQRMPYKTSVRSGQVGLCCIYINTAALILLTIRSRSCLRLEGERLGVVEVYLVIG